MKKLIKLSLTLTKKGFVWDEWDWDCKEETLND